MKNSACTLRVSKIPMRPLRVSERNSERISKKNLKTNSRRNSKENSKVPAELKQLLLLLPQPKLHLNTFWNRILLRHRQDYTLPTHFKIVWPDWDVIRAQTHQYQNWEREVRVGVS